MSAWQEGLSPPSPLNTYWISNMRITKPGWKNAELTQAFKGQKCGFVLAVFTHPDLPVDCLRIKC